jgi:hypothetical protein
MNELIKTQKSEALVTDPRNNERGRIGIPLLLWIGGVPLSVVVLLWFFFFRG